MVDMGEIVSNLIDIFTPFVSKAMIAVIIIAPIGIAIDLLPKYLKNRKNKEK